MSTVLPGSQNPDHIYPGSSFRNSRLKEIVYITLYQTHPKDFFVPLVLFLSVPFGNAKKSCCCFDRSKMELKVEIQENFPESSWRLDCDLPVIKKKATLLLSASG